MWIRRLLIAGCLLLTVVLPSAPAASAVESSSASEMGIEVEVGFGRQASSTTWNLVQVTVTPPVPLTGRLEVRSTGAFGVTTDDQPLEVAAGATRVMHLLLPPAEELSIAFVDAGGDRVRVLQGTAEADVAARVGAIGSAPPLPSPLNTAGTDKPIRGVAVDPAVLALGPRALDALDALLISATELDALPADQRSSLEVAVANGLDLLVHARPGDGPLPLAWDPAESLTGDGATAVIEPASDAWTLTPAQIDLPGDRPIAAAVRAGNGRVTVVGAAPGDGGTGDARELWTALIQLRAQPGRPLGALDQGGDLGGMLFGGGSGLPSPLPFALFALAFVVLVGPVNGFALRRLGRREMAWITVPVITVVFTAIALGAATARAPVDTPVVRAAWWLDGVGQEVTVASVQSPGRGTTELTFPGARDGIAGARWSHLPSTLERSGDETTVRVRLETLQLASVVAWGTPEPAAPLTVDATVQDGRVAVEITNDADVPIDDVEVELATSHESVGRIEPGASASLSLDDLGTELARPRHAVPVGGMGMGGMRQAGRAAAADPGPAAARTLLAWDQLSGSPGTVWVTGSTSSDLGLAVPAIAGRVDDRGSFVAVGVTPSHLDGVVLPHEVARTVLRTSPWDPWRPSPLEFEGQDDTVLRYQLPGPELRGELHSTLDVGQDLGARAMEAHDPWGPGCFEVTTIDPDGNAEDPTEECGEDVACPRGSQGCSGSDTSIEACFEDGTCQIAVRVGGLDEEEDPQKQAGRSGLEVFDHATSSWIPLEQAFDDGRATGEGLVSPLGEVLVRSRRGGYLDLGQRGLGVGGAA